MGAALETMTRGVAYPIKIDPPVISGVAVDFNVTSAYLAFLNSDKTRTVLTWVPGGGSNDGSLTLPANPASQLDFGRTAEWTRDDANLVAGLYAVRLYVGALTGVGSVEFLLGQLKVVDLEDGLPWGP